LSFSFPRILPIFTLTNKLPIAKAFKQVNMEIAKANPDIESLKLILWLAGSVITLLLLIVSYFLSKQIKVQESLTKAVNSLTTAVTVLESQQAERHPVIQRRLNIHGQRLDKLDNRITKIETKCTYHHGEKTG
jgi:beta-lactamase regulating signal transducer with metallopeptidase domain